MSSIFEVGDTVCWNQTYHESGLTMKGIITHKYTTNEDDRWHYMVEWETPIPIGSAHVRATMIVKLERPDEIFKELINDKEV